MKLTNSKKPTKNFTGMLDIKGKKIYQNDTILCERMIGALTEDPQYLHTKCKVIWSKELYAFGCKMLQHRNTRNKQNINIGPLRKDDFPLYAIKNPIKIN